MKFLQSLTLLIAFGLTNTANAVLIDNGDWTTDSDTGLDWIDLSITDGYAYSSVLDSFSGWRYATNSEVVGLFNTAFSGYYDTNSSGYSVGGNLGTTTHPGYAGQYSDMLTFSSLFGYTHSYDNNDFVTNLTYGLFEDELGKLTLAGAYEITGLYGGVDTQYSVVYSPNYTADYAGIYSSSHFQIGIYLVRDSTGVPEPSSLLLLGMGLLGLMAYSRRKIK